MECALLRTMRCLLEECAAICHWLSVNSLFIALLPVLKRIASSARDGTLIEIRSAGEDMNERFRRGWECSVRLTNARVSLRGFTLRPGG